MTDLQEIRAAVVAAKRAGNGVPIIAEMSFTEENNRTMTGTDAKTASVVLEALGVHVVGANCGRDPKQMRYIISEMGNNTNLPLIAQPNAGIPKVRKGETFF